MKDNILLAVAAFAVRLLLTAFLCLYIRYQARGFSRLTAAEVKKLREKYGYRFFSRLFLNDIKLNAKANKGWVRFFFFENIAVLVLFDTANVFATVYELLHGQTPVTTVTVTVLTCLVVLHWLATFYPNEKHNYDWKDKRRAGKRKWRA